jgi:hypothetical protein
MTGVSLEALQHVPLFIDWNRHEVQEIARLFNEHRFSKGERVVEEGSVVTLSFDRLWRGRGFHWP